MAHQIWQSHIPGWVIRQIDEGQVFFFFSSFQIVITVNKKWAMRIYNRKIF